jgi:ribonucleoside-diphosphate reductase alpha chain
MDSFGTAISIALQYGVPLDVLVYKFSHTRFEPMGHTTNPEIRTARSVVDYIFRWLGLTFLPGFRESQSGSGKAEGEGDARAAEGKKTKLSTVPVNGNGAESVPAVSFTQTVQKLLQATSGANGQESVLSRQMGSIQADAPSCSNCGCITYRNAACYLCPNCGQSNGCS